MISYKQFLIALKTVNEYRAQEQARMNRINAAIDSSWKHANVNYNKKIYDSNLSVRLLNILKQADDELGIKITHQTPISELSKISFSKFSKLRNCGLKTRKELQDFCSVYGITLLP